MANDPHYRLIFSGTIGPVATPAEIFSFSLAMLREGPGFLVRTDLPVLADLLGDTFINLAPIISSTCRVTRTRLAAIGDNGKVVRDITGAYIQGDDVTIRPGSAAGAPQAPQVAWAASLRTPMQDPVGRGRFFLPGVADILGDDLRLTTAQTNTRVAAIRGFINALNDVATAQGGIGAVCVASAGSLTKGLAPANRAVTAVAGGRVLDTMRSRRNALEEESTVVVLP